MCILLSGLYIGDDHEGGGGGGTGLAKEGKNVSLNIDLGSLDLGLVCLPV